MKNLLNLALIFLFLFSSAVSWAEETTDDTEFYTLVTDESQLYDGAKIVIVGILKNQTPYKNVALSQHNTNNFVASLIELNDDGTLTPTSETRVLTLQKSGDYWVFLDEDGYLYDAGDSKKSDSHYLKTQSSITKDSYLTFDFSAEDHTVLATFSKTSAMAKKLGCTWGTSTVSGIVNCYYYTYPLWFYVKNAAKTIDEKNDDLVSSLPTGTQNLYIKRTFYNDGWNTWCMPFGITQEKLVGVFGEGTEVAKYTRLNGRNMVFDAETGDLEAGTPYLVKPVNQVANPHFLQVEVEEGVAAKSVEIDGFSFCGTLAPYTMAEDGTELFLNSSNKLSKPASGKNKMRGLRAYFKVPSADSDAKVSFMDNTTGICNTSAEPQTSHRVYNLMGAEVSGDTGTLPQGIYVKDGKKIYVK